MITNPHSIVLLEDKTEKIKYNHILYINKFLKKVIELLIKLYNSNKNKMFSIKNKLLYSIKFVKLLIIYIIEKYYYDLNFIYFAKKASIDKNVFDFFITLNELKEKFTFTKKEDKPYVRLIVFYITLLISYLFVVPGSWFLLKVCTDPQNWFSYHFEQINLTNLL